MQKIKLQTSMTFQNLLRALANLERSLASPITEARDLSGIIKDFEMVFELSWKVMKKNLLEDGHTTQGSRDVFSTAYRLNYIDDERKWLAMIEDRNYAAHVYDEQAAQVLVERIRDQYFPLILGTFGQSAV